MGHRLLVLLNALANRPAHTRFRVLVAAGVVAVVLGTWGWLRYIDQQPDEGADPLTLIHGLLVLVVVDGPVEQAPWQLAVARVVAPLVAAWVLIEVVLEAGGARIRAALARRSIDHVVVVGPMDRIGSILREEDDSRTPVLAVSPGVGESSRGVVVVPDEGSADGWIAATNAARARKVVIATGRDARTLVLLAAALDSGVPAPRASLIVEVDDPRLALQVSVLLATEHPAAEVEVICVDDVRAAFVSRRILDSFAGDLGFDDALTAPQQDEVIADLEIRLAGGVGALASVPVLAVIGDGPMSRLLVDDLASGLVALRNLTSRNPFSLAIVDPAGVEPTWSAPAEAMPPVAAVAAEVGTRFAPENRTRLPRSALSSWLAPRPLVAVVDYVDSDETARCAIDLVLARPGARVWVVAERELLPAPATADGRGAEGGDDAGGPVHDPGAPEQPEVHQVGRSIPGPDLVLLSHAAVSGEGCMVGPFTRMARDRLDHLRVRGSGTDATVGVWTSAQIRAAVHELHRRGWRVMPASGADVAGWGPSELTAEVRDALLHGPAGGLADPDELVRGLARVGLVVLRPQHSMAGTQR